MGLFVALMITWLGSLTILGLRYSEQVAGVLVAIFACVFLGFWTVHQPHGSFEDWLRMSDVVNLRLFGVVPQGITCYCWWPGTAIWGSVLSDVTGVEIIGLRIPVVLLGLGALAVLLFALLRRLLADWRKAFLCAVVALMGNVMLARFHLHPAYFVLIPLLAFFLIAARPIRGLQTPADTMVLIVLAFAITITHFVTSILLLFMAVGYWFAYRLRRELLPPSLTPIAVALLFLLPLGWQMYWPVRKLEALVRMVPEFLRALSTGAFAELLWYARRAVGVNIGGSPPWANAIRLGWLAGLYALSIPVGIFGLLSKRASPSFAWTATGLLSIGGLTLFAAVIGQGGEQYYRFITYGSFVAAPLILLWLVQLNVPQNALVRGVSVVIMFVSIPTFLANNNLVSTAAHYNAEVTAAQFLGREARARGARFVLYENGAGSVVGYYNAGGTVVSSSVAETVEIRGEADFRRASLQYADSFLRARDEAGTQGFRVFIMSKRFIVENEHWLGNEPSTRVFELVEARIDSSNRFFDNGFTSYYN
jgi:hypothetical protein